MTEQQQRDVTEVILSFVAPVHNEAEVLPLFYARLREAADKLNEPYEIIFVDDGSTDESLQIIGRLHQEDDHVKYVVLSRNFGHQEAITAGYDYACGAAVISLDADCQHPPEVIAELVAKWRQGYEVVYTVKRHDRQVSWLRRLAVKCVYRLIRLCSGLDVIDQADFRLLDRKVVEAVRRPREKLCFLRGLVRWVGFRQAAVEYEPAPRQGGTPSYTLGKLARMGSAGLFNFSLAPLRLIALVGAVMLAAAVAYAVAALVLWPFVGVSLLANLILLAVGLVGMQLGLMGLLAEYVGRIYEEAKDRPIYVAREVVGFAKADEQAPPTESRPARAAPPTEPSTIRLFT